MSIFQLILLLLLISVQSSLQKTDNSIHSLLSKRELRTLFGHYDKIPSLEIATVSWQKFRRKRYSDFHNDPYHANAVVKTNKKTFHLQLRQHSEIIAPNFKITVQHANFTEEIESHQIPLPECLYHGHVSEQGVAAVSTCNKIGLTGVIIIDKKTFVLQPLPPRLQDEKRTHVVYEKIVEQTCGNTGKSMVAPEPDMWELTENSVLNEPVPNHQRNTRAATNEQRTIETAVFVDDIMYDNIKDEFVTDTVTIITDIVFTLINSVQLLYNQPSLHTPFKIVLIKLEILTSASKGPNKARGDITDYLTNFCNWQTRKNPGSDKSDPDHWDHSLMLSGLNLYQDTPSENKVIGLAWVSGMCRRSYSCSINEGNSFETTFVITHEMGHNLGMHHDGTNNSCSTDGHIMSPSLGPGKITWSSCSEDYLNKFLNNSLSKCLDDSASPSRELDHESSGMLPGQKYSPKDQCRKAFGAGYRVYTASRSPFENICRELWCAKGTTAKRCHPALDGSTCASRKICKFGECVTDDRKFTSGYDQRLDKEWRDPTTEPSFFSKAKNVVKNAASAFDKIKGLFG